MHILILRPSSREREPLLPGAIKYLEAQNHLVTEVDTPTDDEWPFTSSSVENRANSMNEAMARDDLDVIWCARGGYGASDLLDKINWTSHDNHKPKTLVGFSDISSLHWPVFQRLGWPCLHAPMPATQLWGKNGVFTDVDETLKILDGSLDEGGFTVSRLNTAPFDSSAQLLGGCLSIIASLIGTPFIAKPNAPFLFFFEDTGEPPPRLLRYLNQISSSGLLENCAGFIVGDTRDVGSANAREIFLNEMTKRFSVPIWASNAFGHTHTNAPIPLGAHATINETELKWKIEI